MYNLYKNGSLSDSNAISVSVRKHTITQLTADAMRCGNVMKPDARDRVCKHNFVVLSVCGAAPEQRRRRRRRL